MPHIIIEYSANIRQTMDLPGLINTAHQTAINTGVFPAGGTRTRGEERTDYKIADGHPDNGFVHVMIRLGHGRDEQTLKHAGQAIFDAIGQHLQPLFNKSPLAISMEMQEIHPVLTFKHNNVHDYVKSRDQSKRSG